MKTILITFFLSCFMGNLFAQKKCNIVATYPLYRTWMPGAKPIDENGKETKPSVNLERSIYITTTCDTTPIFSNIYYDKVAVRFSVQKPNEQDVANQIDVEGNKIKFAQPKGSTIWKIDIVAFNGKPIPQKPTIIKLLQKVNKKTTIIIAKKETELVQIATY
jgi:hypothetical protein